MSEYERLLSETTRMEVLGFPRDWSVIQHRFHPFHPQRIIILPSGDPLGYATDAVVNSERNSTRKSSSSGENTWSAPLPPWEKLESTFWIMDVLTGHHRVPECSRDGSWGS